MSVNEQKQVAKNVSTYENSILTLKLNSIIIKSS